MDKEFKNKLSQNLHLHFGYFYDQNGNKIKPDEIVTWFEKQEQPIKSVEGILGDTNKNKEFVLWHDVFNIFLSKGDVYNYDFKKAIEEIDSQGYKLTMEEYANREQNINGA